MNERKQVRLDKLPGFINNLVKQGNIIRRTVKNGNTGGNYVLVEWNDPKEVFKRS